MVSASELVIECGRTPQFWEQTSYADSRFSEVAELKFVCWLDIRGKMETKMLSLNTSYGAYLVFRLAEIFCGLESANAVVRIVFRETYSDAEERAGVVHLQRVNTRRQTGQLPMRRSDGWMEVELETFYNEQGDDHGDAEARLTEISHRWKSGLIVERIEFRPK